MSSEQMNVKYDAEINECPCGGGQSCIVMRRKFGAWVYEDIVMVNAGLTVRENCHSRPTIAQQQAMEKSMRGYDSVGCTTTCLL